MVHWLDFIGEIDLLDFPPDSRDSTRRPRLSFDAPPPPTSVPQSFAFIRECVTISTEHIGWHLHVKSHPHIQEACRIIYRWFFPRSSKIINYQVDSCTHLELTAAGMDKVINTLDQARAFGIKNLIFANIGGSFSTFIAHMTQHMQGKYFGIELCARSCFAFGSQLKALLNAREASAIVNHRIAMLNGNIMDFSSIIADVIYAFDKVFPDNVWYAMFAIFMNSPHCQSLVTFKPGRSNMHHLHDYLLHFIAVINIVTVPDKGNTTSTIFLVKKKDISKWGTHAPPDFQAPSPIHQANSDVFWSENVAEVCLATDRLIEDTGFIMETGKKEGKRSICELLTRNVLQFTSVHLKERRKTVFCRQRQVHVAIVVNTSLQPGEEITVAYNRTGFKDGCRCGCVSIV
jgi:hypothetical protein